MIKLENLSETARKGLGVSAEGYNKLRENNTAAIKAGNNLVNRAGQAERALINRISREAAPVAKKGKYIGLAAGTGLGLGINELASGKLKAKIRDLKAKDQKNILEEEELKSLKKKLAKRRILSAVGGAAVGTLSGNYIGSKIGIKKSVKKNRDQYNRIVDTLNNRSKTLGDRFKAERKDILTKYKE